VAAIEANSETKGESRRRIFLLALGHFTNDTYPGFLAPLQPVLMTSIGYNLTLAGLLSSVQAIANSIMQPVFGHFTDRLRRPWLVVLGPLVTALCLGSIGLWHSYSGLLLIIIIGGLGTAAFHPQGAVLASQGRIKRRGLSMSLFVTGGNAGHALGPVIILSIVSLWGVRYSYLTILYGLVVVWLLWRYLPKTLPAVEPQERSRKYAFMFSGGARPLLFLWLVVAIRAFIISSFMTFGPIFLHDRHFSLMLAGLANTILEISGSVGNVGGGMLSDHIGRKPVILLSLLLALPFFYLYLCISSIWSLVMLAFAGFFLYSSVAANILMAQEYYPGQTGTVSSLMMGFAWGIGGLCVTPLGAVAESIGVQAALSIPVYCILLAVGIALLIPVRASHAEPLQSRV